MPERKPRGKIRTEWDLMEWLRDPVYPADGYMLPRRLTAHATENPEMPDVQVDVVIKVSRGHARAVKVTIEARSGISWEDLSKVPVRDIVGTAVLTALHTSTPPDEEGRVYFTPINPAEPVDEVRQDIVRRLVRYRPKLERFDREAAS